MSGVQRNYGVVEEDAVDHVFEAIEQSAIIDTLDLLINGQYAHVPDGTGPLSHKIKELADKLHAQDRGELLRVVHGSVTASEAVTAAAEMMRDVRDVDSGAQSISSAAEEMVASVAEISSNAEAASAEAGQANEASQTAMDEAQKAVMTMGDISKAVEGAVVRVDSLTEASEQIGEIVSQIDAIAKQTNLLALNATIEAARAGEMGKGFAVVAGEVKTLANQTSQATDDIRERIGHLRGEMSAITKTMQEGAEAVSEGSQVISATGRAMSEVTKRINGVTGKMRDVAEILAQQSMASNEISESVLKVAEMSGHNVHAINHLMDIMEKSETSVTESVGALGEREIMDFAIHAAKSDHMIWRRKLAQMAVGRISLDPGELADQHTCRLGKWYDALEDESVLSHPAFKAMEEPHATVHSCGIEAARLFGTGDLDGAMTQIHQADGASHEVLRLLDELAHRGDEADS